MVTTFYVDLAYQANAHNRCCAVSNLNMCILSMIVAVLEANTVLAV